MRRVIAQINIRDRIQMRDMYRMHARYFVRDELFETLDKFQKSTERIASHLYQNGGRYEGQWRGGFRWGVGKMTWADGASYKGDWEMGYASGRGVFIDCLGNKYDGEFKLSMANGTGTYTNTLGAVYEGQWLRDM